MKRLLLSLMAMCSMAAQAQSTMEWALVEPESGAAVPMSRVGFLLAADADDTFAVVCNDGSVISGARSVSFAKIDVSGIGSVSAGGDELRPCLSADGQLRLTGCADDVTVTVYDSGGRTVRTAVADGGRLTVDVSGLTPGVYVLRAGNAAVKFVKK